MTEDIDYGRQWADWLREHLAGRPQKWLVNATGGKIGKHLVSSWLTGKRPSIELAVLTADAFKVKRSDALKAAGYDYLADDLPQPPIDESNPYTDPLEREIWATTDLPEAERRQWIQLMRERRRATG